MPPKPKQKKSPKNKKSNNKNKKNANKHKQKNKSKGNTHNKKAKSSSARNKKHNNRRSNANASLNNWSSTTIYIVIAFLVAIVAFVLTRNSLIDMVQTWLSSSSSARGEPTTNPTQNGNATISYPSESQADLDLDLNLNTNTNMDHLNLNHNHNHVLHQPIINKNKCETHLWLNQNGSLPGYHVLCVEYTTDDVTATQERANSRRIQFFRNGLYADSGYYTSDARSFRTLRLEMERILDIKHERTDKQIESMGVRDQFNRWAMYDCYGQTISRFDADFLGTILIFEGGNFIFPPIHIGFKRTVIIPSALNMHMDVSADARARLQLFLKYELKTLSVHPIVLQIRNFIRPSHSAYIINKSESEMRVSGVSHMHTTAGDANQWRTSKTHWLSANDPVIRIIDAEVASLTHIPVSHQETVQVLKYEQEQQYDSHWDYFDPDLYKGTAMESKIRGGRNRLSTLFWYMTDVYSGGYTYFPRSGKLREPMSYKLKSIEDCNVGLKVVPKKGSAILFYSMKPDGSYDRLSLHGACPVGAGYTKWAANKWVWSKSVTNHL